MRTKSLLALLLLAGSVVAEDLCWQPSPEEMAKDAGVIFPKSPWHVANLWWEFEQPVEHFTTLEMDATIDREVPDTYNLYLSPCGIAKINGLQFYGGLQSNVNGWANKESRQRVHPGKGALFSRWSSDKDCTWFHCRVKDAAGVAHEVGSLRFEGTDFTFWPKHSAFVEVYSTAKIPKSGIPKVNISFGWPRLNGAKVALKKPPPITPIRRAGPPAPPTAGGSRPTANNAPWRSARSSSAMRRSGGMICRSSATTEESRWATTTSA